MYNISYKFRLYPNKKQQMLLEEHFNACRFVYNHFLEEKIKYYKETKKTIGWMDQAKKLSLLKKQEEYGWLKNIGSQCLQQSILNLDHAYTNFFRSGKGFPKFKSKKFSKKSFTTPLTNGNIKVDLENKRLSIPKFTKLKNEDNRIKCIFHREIKGNIKQCTISQDKDGKFYVSIFTEVNKEFPLKPSIDRNKAIGIDFGVKTFLTLSNGEKIDSPKYFKISKNKLAKHQEEFSKLEKDSTKWRSKKEQITKLHSKIARQRKDFLDKLSHKLTNDSQVDSICIENLSIKDLESKSNKHMNQNYNDLAWNMFVNMLNYKSNWYGKNLIVIGKFDPSTQICNKCGYRNYNLTLNDREWVCPNCGENLDRDINAAKNILDFAITNMNFKRLGTSLLKPLSL